MEQNQDIINASDIAEIVVGRRQPIEVCGVSGSERAYLLAAVQTRQRQPMMVVAASAEEGLRLAEDLRFFSHGQGLPVLFFSAYPLSPLKFLSYHNQTASDRIQVLYRLMTEAAPCVVVTTVQALLQRLVPRNELNRYAELLQEGEEIDRERLIAKLISGGYLRTAIVEEPGDFSVRGGIVDVFSPLYSDPLRIELFGDRVESLRFFSAADQRRLSGGAEAVLLPAREAILRPDLLPEILNRIRLQAAELDVPVSQVRRVATQFAHQEGFPGIESLLPLVYPHLDYLGDYLPSNTLVVLAGPEQLDRAGREFAEQVQGNFQTARQNHQLCVTPESLYLSWEEVRRRLAAPPPLTFKTLEVVGGADGAGRDKPAQVVPVGIRDNRGLSAALRQPRDKDQLLLPLAEWIREQQGSGRRVRVVCPSRSLAERLESLLHPYGLRCVRAEGIPLEDTDGDRPAICLGRISSGFVWPAEKLAVVAEEEIFGVRQIRRARPEESPARARARLFDLQELKQGDLVVHSDHGIGQYEGLQKLSVEGARSDFLVLVYQGGDKLYLPVDRMAVIQKYMGVEGQLPALDKMGGRSWERVKARVKRSAERIAGELLRLYAQRKVAKGFGFEPVDGYLRDFETGFPYEETTDQLKAIDQVLADMQQTAPMDRLVCGDVGYGKTEVALRAAFVAVNNGKQVAILVPTTILAEQHYATFRSRFQRYPVNVACLSRFRSRQEQQAIVAGLQSGSVDIVVGTHRLIQKDVAFKDLGLLVLDEEQRFGVRHKEKLKRLRAAVDVLALTATPIPRTLHMSLTGIRDVSLIQTPPEYRKAILTYISEFDGDVIAEAIRRELRRKGQVFFVHNHIDGIHRMARKLQELVPEARLDVAHGQMAEEDLERVMYRFMNRDIDLLVCTTIIESGLDIATANTIIVNRADCFGLAQMYQLRGRVGRSDEQAYAYLLIPDESLLTADARKRLKVLMEHSDLGSGFQIAMNDLEIRGGGAILGASQSGHVAAVGYDMFLQLMEEAVSELKGEPVVQPLDPEINIQLSAYLSEAYIPDIDQRMLLYRRLARMTELQEIGDIRAEISDRFGPLPEEATHLLFKIMLKVLARQAGVARLDLKGPKLVLVFSPAHAKDASAVTQLIQRDPARFEISPDGILKASLTAQGTVGQLAQAKNLLQAVGQRVNSQEN
jgi:transcription-repair coupling factor (superfamily II helicase)